MIKKTRNRKPITEHLLKSLGAVDTTPRQIKSHEKIEFRCRCGSTGFKDFSEAKRGVSRHGFSFQCEPCRRAVFSDMERRQEWLKKIRTYSQSEDHKERARQNGRKKIKNKNIKNVEDFWEFPDGFLFAGTKKIIGICKKCGSNEKKPLKKFIELSGNFTHGCNNCWTKYTKTEEYAALMLQRSPGFTSEGETDVMNWIKNDLNIHCEKTKIGRFEIDVFIPEVNIGIEYNGLYWHSEAHKTPSFHLRKTNYLKKCGVRVIHVFEHIWRDRNKQIKNYIISAIGKNQHKIGARKCELKEVDIKEARAFINENHIQTSPPNIKLAVGLFFEEKMVCMASFGSHHRSRNKIVMNRLASLPGYSVSGGISKIMKYASEYFKEDIITWSDNSISTGDGYIKSGWEKEKTLSPDYFYTNNIKVFSKQSRKKSAVNTPEGMTEHQHALNDGLLRVYDCGKTRYIWKYVKK